MPRTQHFHERIGSVFIPEADTVAQDEPTPTPEELTPQTLAALTPLTAAPTKETVPRFPFPRFCLTSLKPGCYTIGFTPAGTKILGTRYRGTMRVEDTGSGRRISADLYRYRLLDDIIVKPAPARLLGDVPSRFLGDEAADTGGTIPIYRRSAYQSYLKGTGARLFGFHLPGAPCTFGLSFDEFVYNQPATGFSGSFNQTPTRSIRWELSHTATPDFYTGSAFEGTTNLGTVSMRWISDRFRRAEVLIHTLDGGAVAPPADVGGTTMSSIFGALGWDVTVTDAGAIQLPPALINVNANACWSTANLHTLLSSVPGYNPPELDTVWRVHLLVVPATLAQPPNNCGRGIMFDSAGGSDPNGIPREGSATFSDDGYPSTEVPDGHGGSCYGTVADQEQRNVPRAYLRSATHEIGHAFNQIHQGFEGGNDNSIMTPTPGVASVLCAGKGFPDQINLGFNSTVTKHLRHLPDPAVRPGAMDFFGSAVASPEPADVGWLDDLQVNVTPSATRVDLGQAISLDWELTNTGAAPIPAPTTVSAESLVARISVTDPTGKITFMRPPRIESCPSIWVEPLEPGGSVAGSTTLYWGTDGFAFERPGRHMIEVIVLWDVAGAPTAASGDAWVFVRYPTSANDNEVAALLLHPDVGRAVALGDAERFDVARERIEKAVAVDDTHPATATLRDLGLTEGAEAASAR